MAKTRLRCNIFADLPAFSEIVDIHYHRSLVGKLNVFDVSGGSNFWVKRSINSKINIVDQYPSLKNTINRAIASSIPSDKNSAINLCALRRSNIPIPPTGELFLMSSQGEIKLKYSQIKANNTQVINLVSYGEFYSEPNILFELKESGDADSFIVKKQIPVLLIEPAINRIGDAHRLNAQIILYPKETNIETTKTVVYECRIVDEQADEIYSLESGNVTIEV